MKAVSGMDGFITMTAWLIPKGTHPWKALLILKDEIG